MKCLSFLIGWVGQLFVICHFGSEISLQSQKLESSLFHSEWYMEDKNYRKLVASAMLLIPKIKIRCAKIFIIDLETFIFICHSAYSLYSVFININ
jgi:7tm Odorant receptor